MFTVQFVAKNWGICSPCTPTGPDYALCCTHIAPITFCSWKYIFPSLVQTTSCWRYIFLVAHLNPANISFSHSFRLSHVKIFAHLLRVNYLSMLLYILQTISCSRYVYLIPASQFYKYIFLHSFRSPPVEGKFSSYILLLPKSFSPNQFKVTHTEENLSKPLRSCPQIGFLLLVQACFHKPHIVWIKWKQASYTSVHMVQFIYRALCATTRTLTCGQIYGPT